MQRQTARTAADSPRYLSDRQVADFERDGFLYVPRAFSDAEMREITTWTAEVQGWQEVPGRHMAYYEDSLAVPGTRVLQRIENFVPYHDGFKKLLADKRMLGAVEQLFAQRAVLFKEKINFKLPGGDGFKPHQDQQAGWWNYAPIFITALLTIDETTAENGCLEMAAGHHKKGLVGGEWTPLTEKDMADMKFVSYPTKPGDVMYFDSFAPHASALNRTDKPRRVLYITYNRLGDGDHRVRYYADKRKSFPPDVERKPGQTFKFRV
ncbi:MAG: phytanoyl-CoA dioxygenase family protein [Alphaproteobacteria bacterium]|nr:phytanoyl-CoA dioxygenase family protein [Alphaproteobacteria bacterium]